MKITLGSDHAGYRLKEYIKSYLISKGIEVEDTGGFDEGQIDYPDQAEAVAHGVAEGKSDRGILVCGTGIGMSIAANKINGIRAAHVNNTLEARLSREHNDANILCLGGWIVGEKLSEEIINIWLGSNYEEGKHVPRLKKIRRLEGSST